MRCLALAQEWNRQGGRSVFLQAVTTPVLSEKLAALGISVIQIDAPAGSLEDALETADKCLSACAVWLVLDGYVFGSEYQCAVRRGGMAVMCVDDNAVIPSFVCDFILNQNVYATAESYAISSGGARLLLGTRFALIRQEFLQWAGWSREIPRKGKKIVALFGGSDPNNVSAKAIAAIRLITGVQLRVVVGGSNPNVGALLAMVADLGPTVEIVIEPFHIGEVMAWADLAFAAAGSTVWELALLQTPTALVVTAENQKGIARYLQSEGAAVVIDAGESLDSWANMISSLLENQELRIRLSRRLGDLIDGRGSKRVIAQMRSRLLTVRKAELSDSPLVWSWANDPEVRAMSFSSEAIPWSTHEQWYHNKLINPNCRFMIVCDAGRAIGQIRFELADERAVVSVSLAPEARGKGTGAASILCAVNSLFAESPVEYVDAYVKSQNTASIRSFETAGFVCAMSDQLTPPTAVHLVQCRN